MSARWVTFFVWAAVAAGAVFWGLKLGVQAPAAPPQVQVAEAGHAVRGDLSRLLGADAPAAVAAAAPEAAADARFNLLGVVSPRAPQAAREAVALIAVDGRPARAYRIGSVVDGDNVLQAVNLRGATLGPPGGPALIALNLAPPAAAATGVLPPPVSQPNAPPHPGSPGAPPQPGFVRPLPAPAAPPPVVQQMPRPAGQVQAPRPQVAREGSPTF